MKASVKQQQSLKMKSEKKAAQQVKDAFALKLMVSKNLSMASSEIPSPVSRSHEAYQNYTKKVKKALLDKNQ